MSRTIVITDMDGTLLDHAYSFEGARPAIDLLMGKGVPVVLCSSKTRPEIELYRERLGFKDPFIVENGAAIFIPKGYFSFSTGGEVRDGYEVVVIGKRYDEIRTIFIKVKKDTGIKADGFGDMSVKEIAVLAGLPLSEADLAKQREFDEPFIFGEDEKRIETFLNSIDEEGLRWTRGRFYHILGDNDKGRAVRILKGFYEKSFGRVTTIALGDSLNDLPLLREADFPVLVRKKDGSYESGMDVPGLIMADGIGPEGWRDSILALRSKL
jgi:mannosyl-3-phosphoglycerate phosphatase